MKYSELHRLILRNGWKLDHVSGSHYIYLKEGRKYTVPNHGSKEVGRGLELTIRREMKLR